MYTIVLGDLSFTGILILLVVLALPWWAVVDIATRQKEAFVPTGLSKRTWLILLISFTLLTYVIGFGIALAYVFGERPKMDRPLRSDDYGPNVLRSSSVMLLVLVSMTLPYTVNKVRSVISPQSQQARVEGYLRGHCSVGGSLSEGRRYSIKLTTGYTRRIVSVATMAGTTGRDSFYFDVTPGTYTITATSGSISHHWTLVFARGAGAPPPGYPISVAMNVPVSVSC
ncbi:MAG TPA: hypothetical protein VGZ04_08440 [Acidimicrobiales bacterium]|jgi:hypothetical protein|nr:hypothetical protein [Acidimicrobiales bacterium]